MPAGTKRTCVVLVVLALCVPTLLPVPLAPVGNDALADLLGRTAFVLMVGATLGATVVVWLSSRRDALLRRGATASTVCSVLVVASLVWLYASAGPAAIPVGPLGLLLLALVGHVVVTALLPVTPRRR